MRHPLPALIRLLLLSTLLEACPSSQPESQGGEAPAANPFSTEATTARLMAVLETDGDMRLSEPEFQAVAHPGQRFQDHDRDQDGYIDLSELHALLLGVSPIIAGHLRPPGPRAAAVPPGAGSSSRAAPSPRNTPRR